jgi:hypothetical protein
MSLGSGAWPCPCPSMRTHAAPLLSQPYSMDLNGVRIEMPGLQLDVRRTVIATPAAGPPRPGLYRRLYCWNRPGWANYRANKVPVTSTRPRPSPVPQCQLTARAGLLVMSVARVTLQGVCSIALSSAPKMGHSVRWLG